VGFKVWVSREAFQRMTSRFLNHLPLWALKSVGRIASGVPRFRSTRPAQIWCALHDDHTSEAQPTAKPNSVEIRPFRFTFVDLFYLEQFNRLQAGLEEMAASYNGSILPRERGRISDWFGKRRPGVTGRMRCVHISMGEERIAARWSATVAVELLDIAPSVVCLAVRAEPSEEFRRSFESLVAIDARATNTLFRTSGPNPRWSVRSTPAWLTRRGELESLFMKLNLEVAELLHKHIGAAWAAEGPLPAIEVFDVPKIHSNDEAPEARGFWETLEISWRPEPLRIPDSGLSLFTTHGFMRERPKYRRYRILLDSEQFLKEVDLSGYITRDSALSIRLDSLIGRLVIPLALSEELSRLSDEMAELRSELAPELVTTIRPKFNAKRSFYQSQMLYSISFRESRLEQELPLTDIRQLLLDDWSQNFKRTDPASGKDESLVSMWNFQFKRQLEYLRGQTELLRNAQSSSLNAGIQNATLRLRQASLILAFVAFLVGVGSVKGWLFWIFGVAREFVVTHMAFLSGV